MKKLILITILIFLILVKIVLSTKTILYVTDAATDSLCSDLTSLNDKLFCNEILALKYNVKIINEGQVKSNTETWNLYYNASDMIFLGDVSQDMYNTSRDRDVFCSNILAAMTPERKVFATFGNVWKNLSKSIEGCAFYLEMVNFSSNGNDDCYNYRFRIRKSGYITEGYSVGDTVSLYTTSQISYIHDREDDGWIEGECTVNISGNVITDFFPVVNTSSKGAFWGLSKSSNFTSAAWNFFDRTVKELLNDTVPVNITGYVTTDKELYKPTNTVIVDFYTVSSVSNANMSIIQPDGTIITDIPMNQINQTHWNRNYTLGAASKNGTYIVNVSASNSEIAFFKKTFDVIPWTAYASIDNTTYTIGNNVTTTVQITNAYANINFTVKVYLINPQGNSTEIGNGIIVGNNSYTSKYTLLNLSGGSYFIKAYVNDSYERNFTSLLPFTLRGAGNISVNPPQWTVTTDTSQNITQKFNVTNIGLGLIPLINITKTGSVAQFLTLTDTNITNLYANQSTTFNATMNVKIEGNYSGTITLTSEFTSFIISVSLSYHTPIIPKQNLKVAPTSISETTVSNKVIQRIVTLENIDSSSDAIDITANISNNLAGIVTIVSKPSSIHPSSQAQLELKIDTINLQENTYTGTISLNSSVGSAQVYVNIVILGDLSARADEKLSELDELKKNVTELKKQKKNTTEAETLVSSIESLLNDVKLDWVAEKYSDALSKLTQAENSINQLISKISEIEQQPGPDYSSVIWKAAIIIILIIIGITVFKYRNKIKELINKILKRGEEKEEKPSEEKYYLPTGGGYRTEYY